MTKTPRVIDVSFTQGGTVSSAVPLGSMSIVGVIIPTGWVTGDLSFQAADPRSGPADPAAGYTTTWFAVVDDTNTAFKVAAAVASRFVSFKSQDVLNGPSYVRLVSSVAQTQVGGITLGLVCREM